MRIKGTIRERINGCMQRSMNGRPCGEDQELAAMVAHGVAEYNKPRGEKIDGNKFLKVDYPDRAVDLKHGRKCMCNIVLLAMSQMVRANETRATTPICILHYGRIPTITGRVCSE